MIQRVIISRCCMLLSFSHQVTEALKLLVEDTNQLRDGLCNRLICGRMSFMYECAKIRQHNCPFMRRERRENDHIRLG